MTPEEHAEINEALAQMLFIVASDHTAKMAVILKPLDAWMLISAVQLAWRHPGMNPGMKKLLHNSCKQLQQGLDLLHPGAADLLEHGWNTELDR